MIFVKIMIYGVPGKNNLNASNGVEKAPFNFVSESNVLKLDLNDVKKQQKQIYDFIKDLDFGKKNIFIGGDHSISYSLVRGFNEKFSNFKLVVFDAHPDLMKAPYEPSHEEWLRALIDEEIIKKENILLIGIRRNSKNIDKKEFDFINEREIQVVYSDEFGSKIDLILEFVKDNDLYVSFDLDVFDKAIFSATGYPEENGLFKEEVFDLLNKMKNVSNFNGVDIVEYNPVLDKKDEKNLVKEIIDTFS